MWAQGIAIFIKRTGFAVCSRNILVVFFSKNILWYPELSFFHVRISIKNLQNTHFHVEFVCCKTLNCWTELVEILSLSCKVQWRIKVPKNTLRIYVMTNTKFDKVPKNLSSFSILFFMQWLNFSPPLGIIYYLFQITCWKKTLII